MPKAAELKRGSIVGINGVPHAVEDLTVTTPSARGGASLYRFRFRNLATKHKLDQNVKGDEFFAAVAFERREVQFLFGQHDTFAFMDLSDYSQFEVSQDDISDAIAYLSDGLEGIQALFSEGRVLGIELPPVVELRVAQCDPGLRGASATARTKPATLETGLVVQVPEYLEPEETVRVDTRTGKYLSRA